MPSRSNSIAQLFSRSSSIVKLESTRADRHEHNQRQAFFKLPAELRIEIYAYCVPEESRLQEICIEGDDLERTFWASKGDKTHWVYNPQLDPLKHFPPLFGVCRQIRSEFIPLFFEQATVVLLLHSLHKQKLFADVLCDRSISFIRHIELCTVFKHTCWNDPRAVLRVSVTEPVKVLIDRKEDTIAVRSRKNGGQGGIYRPQCCPDALKKDIDRLIKEIQALEVDAKSGRPRGNDFKLLARRTETTFGKKMLKFG